MFTTYMSRFFRQSTISFKALFGWLDPKIYILVKVIDPILEIIFYTLLAGYVYKTKDLTPWIIGKSFLLCTKNTVFGVGTIMRNERFSGTLKTIVATPANKFTTFLSRGFIHIIDAALSVVLGLFVGYLVFGADFSNVNLGLFATTILVAMFSASSLGLLISTFGLISRDMNLLMNTLSMIIFALSGAIFPITRLPLVLQKASYCIPITRSIQAARMISTGETSKAIYSLISQEVFIGVAYLLLGYFLLMYLEKLAREKASLDLY